MSERPHSAIFVSIWQESGKYRYDRYPLIPWVYKQIQNFKTYYTLQYIVE